MDTADLHARILTFLRGELALTGHQVMISLELELAPSVQGARPQQLKKWIRESQPELFEGGLETEKLASAIIQLADDDVETQQLGKYRYVLRSHQHLGGRSTLSFSLSPTYRHDGPDGAESTTALMAAGQKLDGNAAATMILGKHAGDLLRTNLQMFDIQGKYATHVTAKLLEENAELSLECRNLRRENDELKSTRMEREYALSERAEKMHQGNKQFDKVMQLGTIVASKMLGDGGGGATPVGMLLATFKDSITQQQSMQLLQMLTNEQRLMLMEIFSYATTAEQAQAAQAAQNGHGANGATNGAPKP